MILYYFIVEIIKEYFTISDLNSDIFKLIFQDTRDSIAITVNGIHHLVNKAYVKLFHYESEKELIGFSIENLVAHESVSRVMDFSSKRYLGKEAPSFYETKGLKKDGEIFDIEVNASTFSQNGIIHTLVIIRDITDAVMVEKKLIKNNRSLTMITLCHQLLLRAENEQDFINKTCSMIKETGGYELARIVLQNERQQKFYSTADSDSKSIIVINDISSAHMDVQEKEALMAEGYHSLISLPLLIEKNPAGFLDIFKKEKNAFIDENYNLENLAEDIAYSINSIRIKEKQKNLETQLLQAQKMETIGTLAGGIAHDFNNIMTPILGYAELTLSHMSPSDPLYKYNEQILVGAIRAKELVKQILTFSHKENQKKEPVLIGKIVKDAIQLMGSLIPKTITIQKHISKSCGKIMADPAQIHQIIANLCTNSYHAMEIDGGTLTVELKRTTIDTELKSLIPELEMKNYSELIIGDTGSGMDTETKNRIFEPFYTTKPVDKGTGLGLSVVHGIVKNHNGSIIVESEPGKGTIFRIFLPLLHQDEENAYISQKNKKNKQIILLLDNQHEITELLKLILKSSGYDVDSYNSGKTALEEFHKNPKNYSLILTDLYMPEMSGIEFIKEINKKRKDLPSILITAHEDNLTEKVKQEYNIKQIIYKPILKNSLLEAVSDNIK